MQRNNDEQSGPARAHGAGVDPGIHARADQRQAARERAAQMRLAKLAGSEIGPRPWRPAPIPPSAVDLAHYALGRTGGLDADALRDALTLLPAARAEVEALEAGLLFAARSAGMTWAQIADAMGFRSPQACQQHYARLSARQKQP